MLVEIVRASLLNELIHAGVWREYGLITAVSVRSQQVNCELLVVHLIGRFVEEVVVQGMISLVRDIHVIRKPRSLAPLGIVKTVFGERKVFFAIVWAQVLVFCLVRNVEFG